MSDPRPAWLRWAHDLQTIAQAGLTYSRDPFDQQRFREVQRIAAELLGHHTGAEPAMAMAQLQLEPGYVTPKVDVRAAVFNGDQILLVQEIADARWSIPGGWADVGQSAAEAAVREVREETGLSVRATKLLAVLDKAKHRHPPQAWYVYKLFFRCEVLGGELRTSEETPALGWFRRDALPPLSLGRVTPAQIGRMFEHHEHPDWPTDFD